MKTEKKIYGVVTTPLTVWDSKGDPDKEKTKKYIRHLIAEGVHAIFYPGSASEFGLMSTEEQKEMISLGIEAAQGKVPVLSGTGHNSTKHAVRLSQYAEKAGADAVMLSLPHDPKPTQEGLYMHYKTVAQSIKIPVFAYSWPKSFGVEIDPETVARLAEEGYLHGIKDAADDLWHMAEIIRLTKGKITVLAGVDPTCLGGLCLGADGIMSSAADIVPGDVVKMYNLFREGKLKEAAELQLLLLGIFKALCTVRDRDSLVILREGNKMLGQDMGEPVLPSTKDFPPVMLENLRKELKKLGRLK
jgi:4-hydroxy-tetrahydrodipicolinate synthase